MGAYNTKPVVMKYTQKYGADQCVLLPEELAAELQKAYEAGAEAARQRHGEIVTKTFETFPPTFFGGAGI